MLASPPAGRSRVHAPLAHASPARADTHADAPVRMRLHLRGAVQGVGFRPYCLQLARALGLSGQVRNDHQGLWIEAQGAQGLVDQFIALLVNQPPPLARIDGHTAQPLALRDDKRGFQILDSVNKGAANTGLPPDAAVCAACLDELFDPSDRRYRYPFINCTHCGPRYTIVHTLPYDRAATSMAAFTLCPQCRREYNDPVHRRYHAQPNACPNCGPRLNWHNADGLPLDVTDPIAAAVAALRAGAIIAIHGVGGFHLVCDAQQPEAVARLRARKRRPAKPFAVMALNVASLRRWLNVDAGAATLLASVARPIVLLPLHADAAEPISASIGPGLDEWGAMLPSQPLHWLLFHDWLGRPSSSAWRDAACDALWIATSANPSGEPLVAEPAEAYARLHGLADFFLVHDRAIVARCDDSVLRPRAPVLVDAGRVDAVRVDAGDLARTHAPVFLRRARGYVPEPIQLHGIPADAPPVLACGGWLKNTVCVTRGNEAFLSTHIGDLGSAASCAALDENVARLLRFLGVRPQAVAHDRHPDFYSSQRGARWAAEWQVPAFAVQHHQAHLAAVRAEHAATEADGRLYGLILDGIGLGLDGQAWGGECLRLDADGTLRRLAHLPELPMPGGDAAAREPWRMGAAVLHTLGRDADIGPRFADQPGAEVVVQMLERRLNCPATSSAGRLFDAAAALLGIATRNRHEADAAMQLEARARRALRHWPAANCAADWQLTADGLVLDGLWQRLLTTDRGDTAAVERAALWFHVQLADALCALTRQVAPQATLLALGGGCLVNTLLRRRLIEQLAHAGIRALEAVQAPPGDGGLALGQAWVAIQTLRHASFAPAVEPLS